MMNVYVFEKGSVIPIPECEKWAKKNLINFIYVSSDLQANKLFGETKPDVLFTVGSDSKLFSVLRRMPLYIRLRWLHVSQKSEIEAWKIKNCFKSCFDQNVGPRISVFSTAFESNDRIMRPFHSLQAQTCPDWEWVILDDSKTTDTWSKQLKQIAQMDCRIRLFRGRCNDGFIGSVKRDVAMMCRGEFLVEIDHDDELLPTALEDLIHAFESDPKVGLIGSDCLELHEGTLANFDYGGFYGYGFHAYYKEWHDHRWVHVARNGPLNEYTLRNIIGVYNHVRALRRSCYVELSGHDWNLSVADDYELIVRVWLSDNWKIARLPKLLYKQYRNEGGNNFTFIRNAYIQYLVQLVKDKYDDKIHEKLLRLGMDDFHHKQKIAPPGTNAYYNWEYNPTADTILDPKPNTVSIVMPTFKRAAQLIKAIRSVFTQTFQNWILYIIGDKCPVLDSVMQKSFTHDPRVRWWNLHENSGEGSRPRNYALKQLVTTDLVCYLDDDNTWDSNHVESLYKALTTENTNNATFAFSSFYVAEEKMRVLCSKPIKYRIDTSCIMHKMSLLAKSGYWRSIKEYSYAIDFDLIARFVKAKEPWVATKLFTVSYCNHQQNMQFIKHAYDDQQEVDDLELPPLNVKEEEESKDEHTEPAEEENQTMVEALSVIETHDEVLLNKVIAESPVSVVRYKIQ